jgi:hypothetical protein
MRRAETYRLTDSDQPDVTTFAVTFARRFGQLSLPQLAFDHETQDSRSHVS